MTQLQQDALSRLEWDYKVKLEQVRRTGEKLQQLVRRAERAVKQRTSMGRGGMSR